jgi:hypothetical protein
MGHGLVAAALSHAAAAAVFFTRATELAAMHAIDVMMVAAKAAAMLRL